ncbi:MAG: hypothetical protein IT450_06505 [Phycisphaerales bacterium]|nr:hypothetical protein [Phycisphaerales bacterium]
MSTFSIAIDNDTDGNLFISIETAGIDGGLRSGVVPSGQGIGAIGACLGGVDQQRAHVCVYGEDAVVLLAKASFDIQCAEYNQMSVMTTESGLVVVAK